MPIKKRSVVSINLNEMSVLLLQNAGFLTKQKRSTNKRNISRFFNERLIEFFSLNHPKDLRAVEEKLLLDDIKYLQHERDKLEDKMKFVASKLSDLRSKSDSAD